MCQWNLKWLRCIQSFGMSQAHNAEMPVHFLVGLQALWRQSWINTKIDLCPSVVFLALFLRTFHTVGTAVARKKQIRNLHLRVAPRTWAMLVMKKGSQVLKNKPRRTPRVRLAFSALRPCLWARPRSLFTDAWGQQRATGHHGISAQIFNFPAYILENISFAFFPVWWARLLLFDARFRR